MPRIGDRLLISPSAASSGDFIGGEARISRVIEKTYLSNDYFVMFHELPGVYFVYSSLLSEQSELKDVLR